MTNELEESTSIKKAIKSKPPTFYNPVDAEAGEGNAAPGRPRVAAFDEGDEPIAPKRHGVETLVGTDVRQHNQIATPLEETAQYHFRIAELQHQLNPRVAAPRCVPAPRQNAGTFHRIRDSV